MEAHRMGTNRIHIILNEDEAVSLKVYLNNTIDYKLLKKRMGEFAYDEKYIDIAKSLFNSI